MPKKLFKGGSNLSFNGMKMDVGRFSDLPDMHT